MRDLLVKTAATVALAFAALFVAIAVLAQVAAGQYQGIRLFVHWNVEAMYVHSVTSLYAEHGWGGFGGAYLQNFALHQRGWQARIITERRWLGGAIEYQHSRGYNPGTFPDGNPISNQHSVTVGYKFVLLVLGLLAACPLSVRPVRRELLMWWLAVRKAVRKWIKRPGRRRGFEVVSEKPPIP